MDIILSIIVPVYNVNKYLCKCLDSLLCQDLDKNTYEIIVVDDGSTDDSGNIADSYAQKFSNIKVIHKLNGGLSDARNTGILSSKGKYIQFVDSDDYLEPNSLKGLTDMMESENLDILRFNYQKVNENYEVINYGAEAVNLGDYSNKVCDGITFLNERLWYACFAVQFIIKGEILRKQANLFHKGIFYEDAEWTPRIVIQAGRITSTDKIIYNYLIRSNSISRDINRDNSRKRLNDKLFVIDSTIKTSSYVADKRWFKWMVSQMAYTLLGKVAAELYDEKDFYINELNDKSIESTNNKSKDVFNGTPDFNNSFK